MEAWNYEANAQIYEGTFGLISISGFYKRITNYFHRTNNLRLDPGEFSKLSKEYGIIFTDPAINTLFTPAVCNGVLANIAYNDPSPSYIWGVEFEHQMNFGFLPGYLKYITLSYNISVTRSLAHVIYSKNLVSVWIQRDSTYNPFTHVWNYTSTVESKSTQTYKTVERSCEGQPEVYGNAAIGYDIFGFSARLSCFYQDKYVKTYSFNDQQNIYVLPFFKVDLSLKQQITNSVSIFLNINNLNNQAETAVNQNDYTGKGIQVWTNPSTEELYGRTIDLGVRLSL
jgi:hypothetical protein